VSSLVLRRAAMQTRGCEVQEEPSGRPEYGSVLVFVEGRLSHEEMLETMVLAAETRFRLGDTDCCPKDHPSLL
jgi:hypothetical protein